MKAIISSAVPKSAADALGRFCDVFSLRPDDSLAHPVRSHPDMIISVIGRRAILPRGYAEANADLCAFIGSAGYDLIPADGRRGPEYPDDVGLNCALGDRFIVCRSRSTDGAVLEAARSDGLDIIDVNQGYAGCSCIVCGDSVITSDKGIDDAVKSSGRESVLVPNDGIRLDGYDVGFIGGCGGFADGTLYFFGNIDTLPCGEPIRAFAERKGYSVVCLTDEKLTDYGGIKFI